MIGFVYILKDKAGKYYIGSTPNIDRRLYQHGMGHTQTTRNMDQPSLVLSQQYPTLENARWVERKLKKLKRRDFIDKIVQDGYIRLKPS